MRNTGISHKGLMGGVTAFVIIVILLEGTLSLHIPLEESENSASQSSTMKTTEISKEIELVGGGIKHIILHTLSLFKCSHTSEFDGKQHLTGSGSTKINKKGSSHGIAALTEHRKSWKSCKTVCSFMMSSPILRSQTIFGLY